MTAHSLSLHEVSNEDITWACRVLNLPHTAFSGADGGDPRLDVIRSLNSLDIEACPGSGKTTLLVAKLAILARHWPERHRGICVLSHTNVARREIETRLGKTSEGKRLLSYPHFVGTIHSFVNEFLAIPWLRSKPYPLRVVDDGVCLQRRWYKLPWRARAALGESRGRDPRELQQVLRIVATDFSVRVPWKGGTLGANTDTFQAIQQVCRESCEEGYFCYEEMFLWAEQHLDRAPWMREAIRARFPLLFIDEVQDTSEKQSALLFRLFMDGENPVIRQRFGDSNQAIYHSPSQKVGASTDAFPNSRKCVIPNSHRFGQQIADLSNPVGVSTHNLVGIGPRQDKIRTNTDGKHTIFLFDDQTVRQVLPTYAAYLIETFAGTELQDGRFTAVAARHNPDEDKLVPRYVAHYWPEYDHELTASDPRPKTFLQYLAVGLARSSGETHPVVEKIADGIVQLAAILNPSGELPLRKRRHRQVRELLAGKPALNQYQEALVRLSIGGLNDALWSEVLAPQVMSIAEALAGITAAESGQSRRATDFLSGSVPTRNSDTTPASTAQRDNIFRYPPHDPKVEVRVGSIHSVKGETHTATLVLDSYYQKNHHLRSLKPWLIGEKEGGGSGNDTLLSRMRQHYVAMTRPSHLLCLAMREDALVAADMAALKSRGWRVTRVHEGAAESL